VDFDTYMATPGMDVVAFTGDRLMCAQGATVYNILNDVTPLVATLTTGLTEGATVTSLVTTGLLADVNEGDMIVVWSGVFNQTFVATEYTAATALGIAVDSAVANYSFPIGSNVGDVSPLWVHPNPAWAWNDFEYGSAEIYLSGYSSVPVGVPTFGAVYRTTIDTNGINLIVPVLALPLEGGEYPTCLGGYLNLIIVGTNLGVRVCETLALYDPTGNAGDLKSGPLLPSTIEPVRVGVTGVVGNNRFIYFTWNYYDNQSTGLGRCDLSHFIDELAPAYASDLMVPVPDAPPGGIQLDWCTITNSPVMGVPNQGLFVAATQPVSSGTIDSGLITYGIPDDKIPMQLSYRLNGNGFMAAEFAIEPQILPDFATNAVTVATGGGAGGSVPGQTDPEFVFVDEGFTIPSLTGEYFELRTTLYANEGVAPVVSRWLLESIPGVAAGIEISVVINLHWKVEEKGILAPMDAYQEYLYLELLRATQTPTYYVEGPMVFPVVTVDSIDWLPHAEDNSNPNRGYMPDVVVYLKTWQEPYIQSLPTS
jgi:hypothetical protein